MLHQIITDDLIQEVFLECWKRMKLSVTDSQSHISMIHTVLNEKEMIAEKVYQTGSVMMSDPSAIIITSVWQDLNINSIIAQYFAEKKDPVDDDQCEPAAKKSKENEKQEEEPADLSLKKPAFDLASDTDQSE